MVTPSRTEWQHLTNEEGQFDFAAKACDKRVSVRSDDSFGRASGRFARFLNRSLGYLIALRSLFAFVANVLEFFIRQMLNSNKRVASRANTY